MSLLVKFFSLLQQPLLKHRGRSAHPKLSLDNWKVKKGFHLFFHWTNWPAGESVSHHSDWLGVGSSSNTDEKLRRNFKIISVESLYFILFFFPNAKISQTWFRGRLHGDGIFLKPSTFQNTLEKKRIERSSRSLTTLASLAAFPLQFVAK